MKRIFQFLVLGLLGLSFLGCEQGNPIIHQTSKSLVVDLEAVAKALDWDSHIAGKVEEATRNLNAQLVKAAESMEAELKQHQASLGNNPSPEQIDLFKQAQARVQQNIQNNKRIAEQAREAVRNEQILLFRKRVKPVAGRVAQKHEADMVLISNEDVVWFASSVDITGEVIADMRAASMNEEEGTAVDASVDETEAKPVAPDPSASPAPEETSAAPTDKPGDDSGH